MSTRVVRGLCLVFLGGLLSIGACLPLSGTDTAVDPFAGLVGRDCESPFEAPAADRTWGIGPIPTAPSASPKMILLGRRAIASSRSGASEDTVFAVFGQGTRAGAVLFGAGPPEQRLGCALNGEEIEFVLDGRSFTIQGTSEFEGTKCTMDLRGWIAPCANQNFAEQGEAFDVVIDGSVIIDGRKLSVPMSQVMILQSLEPGPCNWVPTTADEIDWTLTNTDPLFASESAAGDVDVAVAGLRQEIASASLSPTDDPTQPTCHSDAPGGSFTFDGETLSINVQWSDDSEGCELHFQGHVIECRTPPIPIGFSTPPMPSVLRIDGEGAYRTSQSSGTLSTLFLRATQHFPEPEPPQPCEMPASLVGTQQWTLSNVSPSGGESAPPIVHDIEGAGEEVYFWALNTSGTNPSDNVPAACAPPVPVVSVTGGQFSIELGSRIEGVESCYFRFTGSAMDCETIFDGVQDHVQTLSIRLEGEGEFDYSGMSGPLDTLYWVVQQAK